MNYQTIYESLIRRGKTRTKQKRDGLHKHRIVPGYDGGKYIAENITLLTRKEHRLVHLLRYKLFGRYGDAVAYYKLNGMTKIGFKQTPEWIEKRRQSSLTANIGMVVCIDIHGNTLRVSKKEFTQRQDLRGVNTGGYKLEKGCHAGLKNPMSGKKRADLVVRNSKGKGKHWYTDGIQSKQFFDHEKPIGWQKGRAI